MGVLVCWNEVGKSQLRHHHWWRWLARCGHCGGIYLAFAACEDANIRLVAMEEWE